MRLCLNILKDRFDPLEIHKAHRLKDKLRYVTGYCSGLGRSTAGQFSIEATLAVPVIVIATVLILFLALFAYLHASQYQQSALAAERATFTWDNSRKTLETGAVPLGAHDGLYWRITSDHLSGIFGWITGSSSVQVSLPVSGTGQSGSNPEAKLSRAGAALDSELDGAMSFTNWGVLRKVGISTGQSLHLPFRFAENWMKKPMEADHTSFVADATELIRLTDLTRSFVGQIKGLITTKRAKQLLQDPVAATKPPTTISSHAQAAAYLTTLVGGQTTTIEVSPGTNRVIDALDANEVAHQAYYTFTTAGLRTQMEKDVELLKSGAKVKGVVWHFFDSSRRPSQAFLNELAGNGIIVQFHF